MVVRDDDSVYIRYVFDLTRLLCIPFGAQPGERGAAFRKDGIKEDTKTTGEFNIIACVAQPCRAHFIRTLSAFEELWSPDRDGRRFRVGDICLPTQTSSNHGAQYIPDTHHPVQPRSSIVRVFQAQVILSTNLQESHGLSKCLPLWCCLFFVASSSGLALEIDGVATVAAYRMAEVWADILRLGWRRVTREG